MYFKDVNFFKKRFKNVVEQEFNRYVRHNHDLKHYYRDRYITNNRVIEFGVNYGTVFRDILCRIYTEEKQIWIMINMANERYGKSYAYVDTPLEIVSKLPEIKKLLKLVKYDYLYGF